MKFAMGMQMKKNAMSRINQIVASSQGFKPLFGNKLEQIGPIFLLRSFCDWWIVRSQSQHAGFSEQQQGYLFQTDVENSSQNFTTSTR